MIKKYTHKNFLQKISKYLEEPGEDHNLYKISKIRLYLTKSDTIASYNATALHSGYINYCKQKLQEIKSKLEPGYNYIIASNDLLYHVIIFEKLGENIFSKTFDHKYIPNASELYVILKYDMDIRSADIYNEHIKASIELLNSFITSGPQPLSYWKQFEQKS